MFYSEKEIMDRIENVIDSKKFTPEEKVKIIEENLRLREKSREKSACDGCVCQGNGNCHCTEWCEDCESPRINNK